MFGNGVLLTEGNLCIVFLHLFSARFSFLLVSMNVFTVRQQDRQNYEEPHFSAAKPKIWMRRQRTMTISTIVVPPVTARGAKHPLQSATPAAKVAEPSK